MNTCIAITSGSRDCLHRNHRGGRTRKGKLMFTGSGGGVVGGWMGSLVGVMMGREGMRGKKVRSGGRGVREITIVC